MDMKIMPASAKAAHFEQIISFGICTYDVDIFIFYTHHFFSSREVSLPAISNINSDDELALTQSITADT